MTATRSATPLLLVGLFIAEANAQWPVGVGPGFGFGGGVGFRYSRHNLAVTGLLGGFGGYYPPYPFFGGSYYRNITIISPPPVQSPPIIVINNNNVFQAPQNEDVERRPGQLLDIDNKDRFDVIRPRKPQPPQEAAARKPEPAPRKEIKKAEPPVPPPAPPEIDPIPEIADAKMAFSYGEFGRSERFLRQASALYPKDPRAFFLLSQAEFARAKYAEAVDSIHTAMRLKADYAAAAYSPKDLYGANAAAFAEHLERLHDTLRRHPDDPVLLFLLAHQLWFDGRRDEAVKTFQRARPLTTDKTFIERFLNRQ